MIICYLRCFRLLPVLLLTIAANKAGAQCPRPELLSANLVTDSSAQLTWTDVGDQYELELRESGQPFTGAPTHVVAGNPPLVVTGLMPGQHYRFQVRTVCTETSDWGNPRTFATDLNNARPCPLDFDLRDTSCAGGGQFFKIHVDNAPGISLGNDVILQGVRIMLEHPWRSDLKVWLWSPDSTRVQLIGGLNAGDKNIGDLAGSPCGQFVELTEQAGALPLPAAAERDNFTGYYLPFQSLVPFSNGQNPNGVWLLEICDNKTNDKGKLRLFQLVFAPGGCPAVDNVSVANVSESSAEVSWTPGTDSVIIEYGPAGFIPGNGDAAGTGAAILKLQDPVIQPVTLSGLTALLPYRVYVRRLCAPGVWGTNSVAAEFFTNCAYTLLENFDTLAPCPAACAEPCPLPGLWQNVPDDDYEWKVWAGQGLTYPIAGPPAAAGGTGKYLYFRNSCSPTGANGKKAVLRSLCVTVAAPASAGCHFSFDLYMNTKTGQMSSLALQTSTDGGQSWTTLKTWSGNRGKLWRREYVNLNGYDGQVAVFQFVVTGVFGAYGDVAIDDLAFYGSALAGTPDYEFFRDADGDGFGDPAQRVILCHPNAPPGYVLGGGDCDDDDAAVFSDAPEILCNQKDENCNGMADDAFIAAPGASSVAVCAGETAVLSANGNATGQFFWFENAAGGIPFSIGNTLILNNLTATKTFYLLDSLVAAGGGCASARVPVTATVKPTPRLVTLAAPAICPGQSINLAALVADSANTNGALTYYFALPLIPAYQLSSSFIVPPATTTYYFLNTAASGCRDTAALTVTVRFAPSVQIAQGDSIAVCRGKSVTLEAGGSGTMPLAYAWNNGLHFANIPVSANATPGVTTTYTVTVTDGNGCKSSDSVQVHTLNNVTQTAIQSVQNPTVCGGTDGSITLQPLDGIPPYTFAWSGPVSGTLTGISGAGVISGLKQGGYRVTVTDASGGGCSMVMPQIVLNAPGLSVEVAAIQNVLCPGQATGSITLDVSGTNPLFQWSNGQTTPSVSGLSGGTYSVTVTDGACVQVLSNLEVITPPALQIVQNGLTNIACFGANSGAIDLAVFGAAPPYSFHWNNNAATEDLSNLPPGGYFVTITDANGCTFFSEVFNISQPPQLLVNQSFIQHVNCSGENNGAVSVNIAGGVSPYKILWNNGASTTALSNLPAGSYSATVTDANACSKTFSTSIVQPSPLTITQINKTDPTCAGAADGRIEVVVSGGVPPYHFNWSNGQSGVGLNILDNQPAGPYGVTVTDAHGCTFSQKGITLSAPQLLALTVNELVPADCHGASTGRIAVNVTGTVGAVSVTWNGLAGGFTLANVPAGQYVVHVQDSRGCAIQDTFAVTQAESPLLVGLVSKQNALCAGEPNGSIELDVSGGTPPYSYHWNNGADTEDLPALPAGSYLLTATDANGCTALFGPLAVSEPPALVVTPAVTGIPCFGPPTGSIELAVSGGIPPYHFQWNTGAATPNIYFLNAGAYTVTVQDASGCVQVLSDLSVVDQKASFSIEVLDIQPVFCPADDNGFIAVRAVNGTPPFQFAWSPPVGLHPNVPVATDQATGLSGGVYSVTVTDAKGCVAASAPLTVEEAPPILFNIVGQTNVACKGDSTGAIAIVLSGGLPPFEFLWSNGASTQNPGQLPAGTYTLTMTDFLGCSLISPPVTITQPATGLQIVLDSIRQDNCGQEEGAIFLHVMGGSLPYAFQWNSGQQTPVINGLAAGQYQLTVTDKAGCIKMSQLYDIQALAPPLNIAPNITDVLCHGGNTGAIAVTASGGTPAYHYFWSNGKSGPNLNGLPAGIYTLTLTDAAGCAAFFDLLVSDPPLLSFNWQTDSTAGGWAIALDVPAGYAVQWSANAGGQTGPVASGLAAGIYFATVTDGAGCSTTVGPIVAGTVGTQQPEAIAGLQLSPNPSSGAAILTLQLERPLAFKIWIFNYLGQYVFSKTIDERAFVHYLPLELQGLSPGEYWVKIGLEDGTTATLRLTIAR